MNNSKRIFNKEEQEIIISMYNNYNKISDILNTLHCGASTLRNYMKSTNLKKRHVQQFQGFKIHTDSTIKYNYQSLLEELSLYNCDLIKPIKEKYKVKEIITLKCPQCNEEFNTTINRFLKTKFKSCSKCSRKLQNTRKINIDEIIKIFTNENYKILNGVDTYKSNQDRFIIECPNGHIYETDWVNFKSGFRCAKCGGCKKYEYDEVKEIILNSGGILLSNIYKDCKSKLWIQCRCGRIINISFDSYLHGINDNGKHYCKSCKGDLNKGENHVNWQGGITTINNYLRETINIWKRDSLFNGNFLCDITGERKNIILHHTQGFNLIVKEVFNETKLPIHKIIEDYTQDELDLLSKTCLEIHYKYGLGVCLNKDLHKKFHKLYGNKNNTLEQYKDFKSKIISGEILM